MRKSRIVSVFIVVVIMLFIGYFSKISITTWNSKVVYESNIVKAERIKESILQEFNIMLTSSLSVSDTNAKYFSDNVKVIMENRDAGLGLLLRLTVESNPNANYESVSQMYLNMQRFYYERKDALIEADRNIFENKQKLDLLLQKYPTRYIVYLFGWK